MALPVTFNLRGQVFTLDLTYDQVDGLQNFICDHNLVTVGVEEWHAEALAVDVDLATVPLFIVQEPGEEDWTVNPIDHDLQVDTMVDGEPKVQLGWSLVTLQGYITGAQWVGVNWRDYVTRVTREGVELRIEDHLQG